MVEMISVKNIVGVHYYEQAIAPSTELLFTRTRRASPVAIVKPCTGKMIEGTRAK